MTYGDELARLLEALDSKAHDAEQVDLWVALLSREGYDDGEVYSVVLEAVLKRRGRADAENFANRVRKRFIWRSRE